MSQEITGSSIVFTTKVEGKKELTDFIQEFLNAENVIGNSVDSIERDIIRFDKRLATLMTMQGNNTLSGRFEKEIHNIGAAFQSLERYVQGSGLADADRYIQQIQERLSVIPALYSEASRRAGQQQQPFSFQEDPFAREGEAERKRTRIFQHHYDEMKAEAEAQRQNEQFGSELAQRAWGHSYQDQKAETEQRRKKEQEAQAFVDRAWRHSYDDQVRMGEQEKHKKQGAEAWDAAEALERKMNRIFSQVEADEERDRFRKDRASDYFGIQKGDISDLASRKTALEGLRRTTTDAAELKQIDQALEDIARRIDAINAKELRMRVGGDAKTQLIMLEEDLKHFTDPNLKLRTEREINRIKREIRRSDYQEGYTRQFTSGKMDDEEYARKMADLDRHFQENEDRIRLKQRREDIAEGRVDPATGFSTGKQNGKGTQGQKSGDRLFAYNMHQAAYAVDDALQVYDTSGIKGAARAASNNITAILASTISNPLASALAVVGTSMATAFIPRMMEAEKETSKTEEALKKLNRELDRLTSRGRISLDFAVSNESLDPDRIRGNQKASRDKVREYDISIAERRNLINANSPVGPALDSVDEESMRSHRSTANSQRRKYNWTAGFLDWREDYSEEEWLASNPERVVDFHTGADGKAKSVKQKDILQYIRDQKAREKQAGLSEDEKAAQEIEQRSVLQRQLEQDNKLYGIALNKRQFEREFANESSGMQGAIFGQTPEEVRGNATNLFEERRKAFEAEQASIRDQALAAGGDPEGLKETYENAMRKFDETWGDWIQQRVNSSLNELASLKDAFQDFDTKIELNHPEDGDWGHSGRSFKREKGLFEWQNSGRTDREKLMEDANWQADRDYNKFEEEQRKIADQAIKDGQDPIRVEEALRKRMRDFRIQQNEWVNDQGDAAIANERAERPKLDKGLRKWFGEEKNREDRVSAFGDQIDLNDPTLRMHEQEQEYWMKVKDDREKARSMKDDVRRKLDPQKAIVEDFNRKAEEIDKLEISRYEKIQMKEAYARIAQEEERDIQRPKSVNNAIESFSKSSVELQQQLLNANLPMVTRMDKQVEELTAIRRGIEVIKGKAGPSVLDI